MIYASRSKCAENGKKFTCGQTKKKTKREQYSADLLDFFYVFEDLSRQFEFFKAILFAYLREMKIYLHSATILYILVRAST